MKPKGENELTNTGIQRFKQVLDDIKRYGRSNICPVFIGELTLNKECEICEQAFPKASHRGCPCGAGYTKQYLIKRIKEIIKTGKI